MYNLGNKIKIWTVFLLFHSMPSPQRYTQAYINRLAEVHDGIRYLQHDIPTKIYTSIHKQTGWSPRWNMIYMTSPQRYSDWLNMIYNMTSPQRYTQAYINRLRSTVESTTWQSCRHINRLRSTVESTPWQNCRHINRLRSTVESTTWQSCRHINWLTEHTQQAGS